MTRARLFATAGIFVILLVIGGITVVLTREPPPEELIERTVVKMARAAEERDLGFIMEQFSPDFRSAEGWGKDDLKGLFAAQILRGTWTRVFVVDKHAKLTSATEADLSVKLLVGTSDAKTLEDLPKDSSLDAFTVEAKLQREADGEWRIVSASHQRVSPRDFL